MSEYLVVCGVGCNGNEYEARVKIKANKAEQINNKTIIADGVILSFDVDGEVELIK